jgi:hypothetical protein
MKKFIVYNSTGKILRTGSCKDADLDLQAQAGEFVMEVTGNVNDALQKVVDGKVVDKDPSEIDTLPALDPKEDLIRAKKNEILRRLAVDELTKEGSL